MNKYIIPAILFFSSFAAANDNPLALQATERAFVGFVQCALVTTAISQIDIPSITWEEQLEYSFAADRYIQATDVAGEVLLTFDEYKGSNLHDLIEAIDKNLASQMKKDETVFATVLDACMTAYRLDLEKTN